MTTMTTITFAKNQKELDRKLEQIKQDHQRLNPESTVELTYLDPVLTDIHFNPHRTMQLLIGIRITEKASGK